jgi:alpha-methylacyl-CoA racemase
LHDHTHPPSTAPLAGIRVLSLALNLPGPAALMRCRQLGAQCLKLEPPAGDPMRLYRPGAGL